jgi:hypothetical protein
VRRLIHMINHRCTHTRTSTLDHTSHLLLHTLLVNLVIQFGHSVTLTQSLLHNGFLLAKLR